MSRLLYNRYTRRIRKIKANLLGRTPEPIFLDSKGGQAHPPPKWFLWKSKTNAGDVSVDACVISRRLHAPFSVGEESASACVLEVYKCVDGASTRWCQSALIDVGLPSTGFPGRFFLVGHRGGQMIGFFVFCASTRLRLHIYPDS